MRGHSLIMVLTFLLLVFVFYVGIQTEATVWTNVWARVLRRTLPSPAVPVVGTLVQP